MVRSVVRAMLRRQRDMKNETGATVQRASMGWPIAAVLIALMVLAPVAFVVYKITTAAEAVLAMPGKMASGVADTLSNAVRPKINVQNIVMSTISSMQRKAKLVVLDTTIDLDVTKDESYTAIGFVYLGTNRVRLIARENRLQYVIPLDNTSTGNFAFDESARKLTIFVARPSLDEEMVSVQSDPAKCYPAEYAGGWMRFDKSDTLARVRKMLRPALLEQGKSAFVAKEAELAGIAAVKTFVDPMLTSLKEDGITVDVQYR